MYCNKYPFRSIVIRTALSISKVTIIRYYLYQYKYCAAPWIIRLWNIFVVLIIFCRTSWICILVTGKKSCGIDMVYCWFSTELNHLRKSFCFEYKKIEGYDQMMQIITDIIKHSVCQQYLEWMSWFKCQSLSFWYFWPWHKNEIVYICYLFVIDIWTKKLLMCGNMTRSMAQA